MNYFPHSACSKTKTTACSKTKQLLSALQCITVWKDSSPYNKEELFWPHSLKKLLFWTKTPRKIEDSCNEDCKQSRVLLGTGKTEYKCD